MDKVVANYKKHQVIEQFMDARERIEALEDELRASKVEYEVLKDQALTEALNSPDQKIKLDEYTISVTKLKQVKIEDTKLVVTWLKRHDYKPEDYQRLDLVKLKPVLTNAIFTQGKQIKGVEALEVNSLRVTSK